MARIKLKKSKSRGSIPDAQVLGFQLLLDLLHSCFLGSSEVAELLAAAIQEETNVRHQVQRGRRLPWPLNLNRFNLFSPKPKALKSQKTQTSTTRLPQKTKRLRKHGRPISGRVVIATILPNMVLEFSIWGLANTTVESHEDNPLS